MSGRVGLGIFRMQACDHISKSSVLCMSVVCVYVCMCGVSIKNVT